MGLAIIIAVIGVAIAVLFAVGIRELEPVATSAMVFGIIAALIFASPIDGPEYRIAPYGTVVDGEHLYFSNYTLQDNLLAIPAHYYKKMGFINSWELCDSPLTISIPEGYDLKINDRTPAPRPHIVSGGCQ